MEKTIISVQTMKFNDRETGKETILNKVFMTDESGGVGFLYSRNANLKAGGKVHLDVFADKSGKLAVKILV